MVDEDIDPSNVSQVLWAMGTRVDPETSIDVIRGCLSSPSNPMVTPEAKRLGNYEMSRAVIIASKPYYWKDQFSPAVEIEPDLARQIREKWEEVFG